MKKEFEKVISDHLGVQPVMINSSLVSAQNRVRLYWSNIKVRQDGLFGEIITDIPQPKDRGLFIKDVFDDNVSEKYFLKDKAWGNMLAHRAVQKAKENGFGVGPKHVNEKMNALRCGGKCMEDLVCVVAERGRTASVLTPKRTEYAKRIRKQYEAGEIKCKRKNLQQLEPRADGKSNTLTTVQKDNLLMIMSAHQCKNFRMLNEKAGTLLASSYKGALANGMALIEDLNSCRIRRLTPRECARLQTIPDWYEWIVSEMQQYKMLGNGWTVDVIKHIFKYLNYKINEVDTEKN